MGAGRGGSSLLQCVSKFGHNVGFSHRLGLRDDARYRGLSHRTHSVAVTKTGASREEGWRARRRVKFLRVKSEAPIGWRLDICLGVFRVKGRCL